MTPLDWRWTIGEAAERIRSRYQFIGRKTGAPFLALIYPAEVEAAVLQEWHAQTEALRPDIDVRPVDVLQITQRILSEIGAESIVAALADPMPGSDPQSELGQLWVNAVADAVRTSLAQPGAGKPVVSLERLAALYPAAGPRDILQCLWDSAQAALEGPVVVFIPGTMQGPRTYAFLGRKVEFMYRGDLLEIIRRTGDHEDR